MKVALVGLDATLLGRATTALARHEGATVAEADAADAFILGPQLQAWKSIGALLDRDRPRVAVLVLLDQTQQVPADLMIHPFLPSTTRWARVDHDLEERILRWLDHSQRGLTTLGVLVSAGRQLRVATPPTRQAPASPPDPATTPATAPPIGPGSSEDVLARLDEVHQRFLNTLVHELNTPLTPIKMQLHLAHRLSAEIGSSRLDRVLDIVERNFTRLERLVQDVLASIHMANDELPLQEEPVDLSRICQEGVAAMQPVGEDAGCPIRLRIQSGQYVTQGDPGRLAQVLDNLLSNALKYAATPEGIDVRLSREAGSLRLCVTDHGPGMDARQQEDLFRPFARVHDQQAVTVPGTGLGLYLCQQIVGRHDGSLTCNSAPGDGATFTMEIPVRAARPNAASPQAP
ncbi:MAG: sensor histidine kinase [Thermoplasmatota archaeon]